jgi:hypothetical protein
VLGGVLILVADGVYLFAISQQGATDGTLRVPFVAGFLAACGVLAVLGASTSRPRLEVALVGFSTIGTLLFGILGIFSIGLLLLVACVPLTVALGRQQVPRMPRLAIFLGAAGLALAVTVVGLQVTSFPVSCPSNEMASGSGSGFLTGSYTWSCVDGKLTVGSGSANSNSGTTQP